MHRTLGKTFSFVLVLAAFRCAEAVEFSQDIRPIFNRHCVACHGGVKQASDLSFIYQDQALNVIEPGQPEDSTLIQRVTSEDDDERMPPPEHGPPLSEHEVELLETWIREGAAWQDHWSFVAPKAELPPFASASDWVRSPIDAFIFARLQEEGLEPAADATPARWLRRASLDLIGLPPTPDECGRFLSSYAMSGEMAFQAEVKRLLNSPRFGERWASIWLDAVRYADSKGLGQDGRRSIWKYRDWVIDALNRDMPFDEFTIAQLAGDLLPDPSFDDLVATACHRLTQTNEEGGTDDEQFRLEAVIDRINTTWQVWQGLTFGCVQCHSHPFDPIQHTEYYQFLSFFNNTADTDLSADDPRIAVPLNRADYDRAMDLDREIERLTQFEWRAGYQLLDDVTRWHTFSEMRATTPADTKLTVETVDGVAQFHTVGTVSKDTEISLEISLPDSIDQLTAIRFTGLPLNPEQALADSEWGFVLSHVKAVVVDATGESSEVEIARVIGDDPDPILDVQLSLNSRHPHGFGAYSRINYPRQAAFVMSRPVSVEPGCLVRVTLSHRIVETGAFPLVTRRGSIAVTDDEAFTEWLNNSVLQEAREEIAKLRRERAEIVSVLTPVMHERLKTLARPTHVFQRGNFLSKGDRVTSGTPRCLPPLTDADKATRLQLARWMARPENPLIGRVTVNRFWAQMFGNGLVETQEDFGSSGARPSHPRLLDDLALRFTTDMGWSVKTLLAELALSRTYRQSAQATDEQRERDPQNRLLSRGPRNRLAAEVVRDQALAISGLLSTAMYGPPVYPPLPANVWKPFQGGDRWKTPDPSDPDRYRRSVYTYTKRSIPFPMFAAFDAPSREFCTARRLPSNTPLQALMTLNDQTFVEASRGLAERMLAAGSTADEQIEFGFRLATLRDASREERDALVDLFEQALEQDATVDRKRVAMTNVASVLLNLDEVLCK